MAEDFKQKIISHLQKNGPSLLVQLSKVIEKDTILTGALLSDLAKSKKIKVSFLKYGTSPYYYLPGQEAMLERLLYPTLKEKEKEVFDLLKKKQILKDSLLEPAQRVAIRLLKDFAIPVQVKKDDTEILFWKWHTLSDEEAKEKILNLISGKKEEKPLEVKKGIEPLVQETKPQPKTEVKELKKEIKGSKAEIQKPLAKTENKTETQKESKKEAKHKADFYATLISHLQNLGAEIISEQVIKKNKEINLVLNAPSSLGKVRFFAKALNKKKITNADISLAYNEAQQTGLPLLMISSGEFPKKANEFVSKKLKGHVLFMNIK